MKTNVWRQAKQGDWPDGDEKASSSQDGNGAPALAEAKASSWVSRAERMISILSTKTRWRVNSAEIQPGLVKGETYELSDEGTPQHHRHPPPALSTSSRRVNFERAGGRNFVHPCDAGTHDAYIALSCGNVMMQFVLVSVV